MEGNIKTYVQQVEWAMDWLDLSQNRDMLQAFVNVVMNLGVL